jgi:hypothetical protein
MMPSLQARHPSYRLDGGFLTKIGAVATSQKI